MNTLESFSVTLTEFSAHPSDLELSTNIIVLTSKSGICNIIQYGNYAYIFKLNNLFPISFD